MCVHEACEMGGRRGKRSLLRCTLTTPYAAQHFERVRWALAGPKPVWCLYCSKEQERLMSPPYQRCYPRMAASPRDVQAAFESLTSFGRSAMARWWRV